MYAIVHLHFLNMLMLYSQTKGVKRKYILYISGSVAYRQYIHECSSPWNPNWLTAVSQFPASSPPMDFISAAALRC